MNFEFKRKVLKNGMTIIFEKRNVPVVSVAFVVRNGGINESMKEKGISHFIEHMLYKGTPSRNAKKIAEEIERNGGEMNGLTSESLTAYWCKMPSKHLNVALEVLSDMVKNPLFDKTELEKERKVIFEELKMRHDSPRTYVFDEIKNYLYEEPFGPSLIGTYDSMNSISRKTLVDKFKKVYCPNNLILCVIGDADFDGIVKFAEKNFGNEKGEVPQFEIKKKNESKTEKREGIDQANLVLAYHSPLAGDKKNYASQVLIALMASGLSSRLFSKIREERNLAYDVKGAVDFDKYFSYSQIYVGTTKENVEIVKELILEEFEKVSKELGEEELNAVKEQLTGQYYISMEDSREQMANLLVAEVNGDASEFYEYEKNIRAVKLDDVKKLAGNVKKGYSFFALVPK